MKRFAYRIGIGIAVIAVGLWWFYPKWRNFTEYDLDESSFDREAMDLVESVSGIEIPVDSKGIRFHYIPPIDPIHFAKISIADKSRDFVMRQIEELEDWKSFPKDFANDRCEWWPSDFDNSVISRWSIPDWWVEAHMVKESGGWFLYLKVFTI